MPLKLNSIGDMAAEEGFGAILGVAMNGLLVLALIFLVLVIMDKVYKKKLGDKEDDAAEEESDISDNQLDGTKKTEDEKEDNE